MWILQKTQLLWESQSSIGMAAPSAFSPHLTCSGLVSPDFPGEETPCKAGSNSISWLPQSKLWKELDQELLLWPLCLFLLSSTSHSHVSLADQGTSSCSRGGQNFWSSMLMKDRWESKCPLWEFRSSSSWAVEITLDTTGWGLRGWRKLLIWFRLGFFQLCQTPGSL